MTAVFDTFVHPSGEVDGVTRGWLPHTHEAAWVPSSVHSFSSCNCLAQIALFFFSPQPSTGHVLQTVAPYTW
jgi:hypothetical protein